MAKLTLDFIPPDAPNVQQLNIHEAGAAAGPFIAVDQTTVVGTYPDYITRYTATVTDATDWFAISWVIDGVETNLSSPFKGGTTSLVQKIIDRVRERDASLNERVVSQEAEAAIQQWLGNNVDPYDPDLVATTSYRQLSGLVYLTMARTFIVNSVTTATGNVQSATMGLVSFKSDTSATKTIEQNVGPLLDLANKELGIATSFVMLVDDIECKTYQTYDHSRLVSGWVSIE